MGLMVEPVVVVLIELFQLISLFLSQFMVFYVFLTASLGPLTVRGPKIDLVRFSLLWMKKI